MEGVGVAAKANGESNCVTKISIAARQKLRSTERHAVEAIIRINAFRFKKALRQTQKRIAKRFFSKSVMFSVI